MFKFKKKKTGCETPEFRKLTAPPPPPAPPTNGYNAYKEECLANCFCGGKAELDGGTYGYPTIYVRCSRCGGRWSMNTYSHKEAIERWNAKMKFYG